jgi:cobalt-precorrin 5A hydrolase
MLACGIGCRRGASAEDIEAAIEALRTELVCAERIAVIATETSKANEPGLRDVADRLGVRIDAFEADELRGVENICLTVSSAALRHKGVPSVAEASALLAAGANGRLLAPRLATRMATCAFAVGDGEET